MTKVAKRKTNSIKKPNPENKKRKTTANRDEKRGEKRRRKWREKGKPRGVIGWKEKGEKTGREGR
ncbi:MAG: hypothetical protein J6L86_01720 [Alphaproteobacteria bacterium]|nr:hypothetical protein [Alphaproteobacteria bacterium]